MQTLQRHPEKHVFGVVDRPEEVDEILEEVGRRGAAKDEVQVVGVDERAHSEHHHGALEVAAHAVEMLSEEHEFNEMYQREIEAGHRLVGIPVSRALDKKTAQDILHRHGAHFINYFGSLVVEELEG